VITPKEREEMSPIPLAYALFSAAPFVLALAYALA
jgi:hypothetical protein